MCRHGQYLRCNVGSFTYKRVNLSLSTPQSQIGGAEVQRHSFFTSVLERGEWLTSHPGCFFPENEPRYSLNARLVVPRASLDVSEKRKVSYPGLHWTDGLPSRCTDYANPAHLDGGELSNLIPCRFTPGKEPGPHRIQCQVGPRSSLGVLEKRRTSVPLPRFKLRTV
jgi:hypothetical protein